MSDSDNDFFLAQCEQWLEALTNVIQAIRNGDQEARKTWYRKATEAHIMMHCAAEMSDYENEA